MVSERIAVRGPELHKLTAIAENIERLSTIELSRLAYTRGVVQRLYEASVDRQGRVPILSIAQHLVDAVTPGSIVVIVTGAGGGRNLPLGENDGPLGAASLAVAIRFGLHATPLVLTEAEFLDVTTTSLRAFGIWPDQLSVARDMYHYAAVDAFPTDERADAFVAAVMALGPSAVICVEKLGVNARGVAHTATGRALEGGRAPAERLIDRARERGIYTVGIGDNGNEIGFGLITDAVRQHKPYGAECQCPCRSGLATVNATDGLIVANVSNWGAYALTAVISLITRNPHLMHDGAAEERALASCVAAGGADGRSGRPVYAADGIPGRLHGHFVDMLHYMVEFASSEPPERPF
jgi:hypothetical protein